MAAQRVEVLEGNRLRMQTMQRTQGVERGRALTVIADADEIGFEVDRRVHGLKWSLLEMPPHRSSRLRDMTITHLTKRIRACGE